MTNLEKVCEAFEKAIQILESTYENYIPEDVLELSKEARDILDATYRPLLDAYNVDKDFCKEIYCNVRDYRDTALTFIDLAIEVLEYFGDDITQCDFSDVDKYIKKSVCWTKKAKNSICN